jgi:hypothetical protein
MPDDPASAVTSALPYIDEHRIEIAASPDLVWTALRRYLDSLLRRAVPLGWLLGTEPPGGFAVAREVPNEHLGLAGRHRFSRYLLEFDLTRGTAGTTLLTAWSHAAFPGLHGRAYRAMVIGTGGHAVGVKHMLRAIRRASLEQPDRHSTTD